MEAMHDSEHKTEHVHEPPPVEAPKPVSSHQENIDKFQDLGGRFIFSMRWFLFPINVGLIIALGLYVFQFIAEDAAFIWDYFYYWKQGMDLNHDLESLMTIVLGFVDASMVANLIVMIVQGSHHIFIDKFNVNKEHLPQWLNHMDTGLMKVKVALSVSTITLVQILKDFTGIENIDWTVAVHRMVIHMVSLVSTLIMAIIWRITHVPSKEH